MCFLFASILSCIKILSTKSVSSSLFPFILVMAIGIILDLVEEIKRYKNDCITNSTHTKVYKSGKFRTLNWSEVNVGNLIKVKNNEIIPADLIVICSSNVDGIFYVQTSNLDGETNLKERQALNYTQSIFLDKNIKKDEINLQNIFQENCVIEVAKPNEGYKIINEIDGKIIFKDNNNVSFDNKNSAVRGTRLKNTKFIYGIVIYTGKETKVMLNIVKHKVKFAYLDKLVDNIVLIIIIIRLVYVIVFTGIGIYYRKKYLPKYYGTKIEYDYLYYYRHIDGKNETNNSIENLKFFTSHFILSQTLLPTSVAGILAITKVIQSLFIEYLEIPLRKNKDEKMKCYSNELLGELGSVKYIFSDKTGTLTKNQTKFKACSIYTSLFDENYEDFTNNEFIDKSRNINKNMNNSTNLNSIKNNLISGTLSHISSTFNSQDLLCKLHLKNIPLSIKEIIGCPFKSQGEALEEFILNMALNHDICVEKNNEDIIYQGANPDEITLVGAAKEFGYTLYDKYKNILSIKIFPFLKKDKNEIKKFKILQKFPFKSERQRSAIIVRDLKTKVIKLYIKGSDTKIFERINQHSKDNILEITKKHVDNFARRGLRTLCYSFKKITENEYNDWLKKYNEIKENIKIEKEEKEKKIESLIEEIEDNCYLLGATGLEDQLQDNVANDVKDFIQAGINFWMLTGDKMDTAESIGKNIKLFDSDTEVFKINELNQEKIIKRMEEIKEAIKEIENDLSNFDIKDDNIRKENINKKVDSLKEKMKNKVENMYEEIRESKSNFLEENNNRDNGTVEYDISKYSNMSILKFLRDQYYFTNSNMDYENSIIFNGKVVKPSIEYSEKFESSKDQEIKAKFNTEINNENILINIDSNRFKDNIKDEINISNFKYKEEMNSKEKDMNGSEITMKKDKKKKKKPQDLEEISINEPLKQNIECKSAMERKNYNHIRKNLKRSINLPTNATEFLEYFDLYLKNIKEALYKQQNSLFLFKLPHLYAPSIKESDCLNEKINKIDWKKKFKFKSYLLHTKIKYSIIINGKSIDSCISEGKASELFWFLIKNSSSVICSQCLPIQKSKIIDFVKKNTKDITLAIGDGENDVNMIKAAHIGIGIFGKEGFQAAFNSDYAFYQFKYLKRLLFNNGRFTLLRNTYFLNMYFFKNFLYTLIPIIFSFFNLFSGTFFYDEFYDSMFNTFVSIIPLITFSIIDEDIDLDFKQYDEKKKKWMLFLLPDLYKQARDLKPFNIIKYIICTFISIIYAVGIYFIFSLMFINMIKNSKGDIASYYEMIFNVYFSIIFIHFFMVYIDTSLYNSLVFIFFGVQLFANILFITVFDRISFDNKLSGILREIIHMDSSFLSLIITCTIGCLPFYILRRAELYFGMNFSNLIKINKLEAIYLVNYYKKKIKWMIRATRAITKFKRILKEYKSNKQPDENDENVNDRKMRKVIKIWEEEKYRK